MKLRISAILIVSSSVVFSATTFSIDAGNNGWTGWTEVLSSGTPSERGTFLGGAVNGSDINTTGINGTVSWSLYANSGGEANRIYDFGSSMTVGQSVVIDMDNPGIATGGVVGFSLRNSSSQNRFEFYYIGGDSVNSYKINDSSGQENVSPTVPFTTGGLSLEFTLLASNTYSFSINGADIANSGLNLTASDISQIRIFNYNAGSGQDAHFNSFELIPESSTALLGGLGMLALLRRRRR
jgi:hypothetical protein